MKKTIFAILIILFASVYCEAKWTVMMYLSSSECKDIQSQHEKMKKRILENLYRIENIAAIDNGTKIDVIVLLDVSHFGTRMVHLQWTSNFWCEDATQNQYTIQSGLNNILSAVKNPYNEWIFSDLNIAKKTSEQGGSNLGAFIKWCKDNYPASNYLLSLGSHSNPWVGINQDWSGGQVQTMTLNEVNDSLTEYNNFSKENKLDILYYGGCLRSNIENCYEHKEIVKYVIASEGVQSRPDGILSSGGDDNEVIKYICENPTIDALNLSKHIVSSYKGLRKIGWFGDSIYGDMHSLDLSKADSLYNKINILAKLLYDKAEESDVKNGIIKARNSSPNIYDVSMNQIDLLSYINNISNLKNTDFKNIDGLENALTNLKNDISSIPADMHKYLTPSDQNKYSGLSIYYPPYRKKYIAFGDYNEYDTAYDALAFSFGEGNEDSSWVKLIGDGISKNVNKINSQSMPTKKSFYPEGSQVIISFKPSDIGSMKEPFKTADVFVSPFINPDNTTPPPLPLVTPDIHETGLYGEEPVGDHISVLSYKDTNGDDLIRPIYIDENGDPVANGPIEGESTDVLYQIFAEGSLNIKSIPTQVTDEKTGKVKFVYKYMYNGKERLANFEAWPELEKDINSGEDKTVYRYEIIIPYAQLSFNALNADPPREKQKATVAVVKEGYFGLKDEFEIEVAKRTGEASLGDYSDGENVPEDQKHKNVEASPTCDSVFYTVNKAQYVQWRDGLFKTLLTPMEIGYEEGEGNSWDSSRSVSPDGKQVAYICSRSEITTDTGEDLGATTVTSTTKDWRFLIIKDARTNEEIYREDFGPYDTVSGSWTAYPDYSSGNSATGGSCGIGEYGTIS